MKLFSSYSKNYLQSSRTFSFSGESFIASRKRLDEYSESSKELPCSGCTIRRPGVLHLSLSSLLTAGTYNSLSAAEANASYLSIRYLKGNLNPRYRCRCSGRYIMGYRVSVYIDLHNIIGTY